MFIYLSIYLINYFSFIYRYINIERDIYLYNVQNNVNNLLRKQKLMPAVRDHMRPEVQKPAQFGSSRAQTSKSDDSNLVSPNVQKAMRRAHTTLPLLNLSGPPTGRPSLLSETPCLSLWAYDIWGTYPTIWGPFVGYPYYRNPHLLRSERAPTKAAERRLAMHRLGLRGSEGGHLARGAFAGGL